MDILFQKDLRTTSQDGSHRGLNDRPTGIGVPTRLEAHCGAAEIYRVRHVTHTVNDMLTDYDYNSRSIISNEAITATSLTAFNLLTFRSSFRSLHTLLSRISLQMSADAEYTLRPRASTRAGDQSQFAQPYIAF